MGNLAALILRVAEGSLLAGHGAQKLFGSFEGPGLQGISGFMEMLGLRPGRPWAVLAGLSEFGGVLTVLYAPGGDETTPQEDEAREELAGEES
jgi:putative oxidoreductase